MSVWCCGVLVITAGKLHSIIPGPWLYKGSNTARGMLEIWDGQNLWQ